MKNTLKTGPGILEKVVGSVLMEKELSKRLAFL
jgi:hypothetical protein